MGANGTKSFRFDHPDDPLNKELLHYCNEGPEPLNTYRGTVWLDAAGAAIVELPHYFTKINKDPRFSLTPIGVPMPMLHIAVEIDLSAFDRESTCSFTIAGGAPGGKVSWRIEAVRNDLWVRQHGAPVEVQMPDGEKGRYLQPALYGQPETMGAHHREPMRPE